MENDFDTTETESDLTTGQFVKYTAAIVLVGAGVLTVRRVVKRKLEERNAAKTTEQIEG